MTKFALLTALKIVAWSKLTFDERIVLYRFDAIPQSGLRGDIANVS